MQGRNVLFSQKQCLADTSIISKKIGPTFDEAQFSKTTRIGGMRNAFIENRYSSRRYSVDPQSSAATAAKAQGTQLFRKLKKRLLTNETDQNQRQEQVVEGSKTARQVKLAQIPSPSVTPLSHRSFQRSTTSSPTQSNHESESPVKHVRQSFKIGKRLISSDASVPHKSSKHQYYYQQQQQQNNSGVEQPNINNYDIQIVPPTTSMTPVGHRRLSIAARNSRERGDSSPNEMKKLFETTRISLESNNIDNLGEVGRSILQKRHAYFGTFEKRILPMTQAEPTDAEPRPATVRLNQGERGKQEFSHLVQYQMSIQTKELKEKFMTMKSQMAGQYQQQNQHPASARFSQVNSPVLLIEDDLNNLGLSSITRLSIHSPGGAGSRNLASRSESQQSTIPVGRTPLQRSISEEDMDDEDEDNEQIEEDGSGGQAKNKKKKVTKKSKKKKIKAKKLAE